MAERAVTMVGRRPSRRFMAGKALREFFIDECWDRAAAMTFFAVLSIPPLAIALVSVLALMGRGEAGTRIVLEVLALLGPDSDALSTISEPAMEVLQHPAAGTSFVLGLATALWMAAGYVGAFGRALNTIYGVEEGRPLWRLQLWHLLTTLVLVAFSVLVLLLLVVSGPVAVAVGHVLGLREVTIVVWEAARWPVILVAGVLVIAVLYYATPNVKHPHFRWASPGAVVALLLAAVASVLFRVYVGTLGRFDTTYGAALAGLVVFGLWLWIINMALLLGAEVDTELDRARQLVSGVRAYHGLHVLPRDTRASEKLAARRKADAERARSLWESHGHTDEGSE